MRVNERKAIMQFDCVRVKVNLFQEWCTIGYNFFMFQA